MLYLIDKRFTSSCFIFHIVQFIAVLSFVHAAILGSGALTSYLNIPHMAPISTDTSVSNKSVYTTLIRTYYPLDTIGTYIIVRDTGIIGRVLVTSQVSAGRPGAGQTG